MTDDGVTSHSSQRAPRLGRQQVAALCWRRAPLLEVLLVTSLRTKRWILPKGWPEAGLTLAGSAAREALEEAGVTGEIEPEPIGHYHYIKEKAGHALPVRVEIFSLKVMRQRRTWAEKGAREILWLPVDLAVARVEERGLRHLLLHFRKVRQAA
jgi:8-oxo-dGTP pyrophosphatase MutT (NUDIX family)